MAEGEEVVVKETVVVVVVRLANEEVVEGFEEVMLQTESLLGPPQYSARLPLQIMLQSLWEELEVVMASPQ